MQYDHNIKKLGSMGAWYNIKIANQTQISISAIALMFQGLESSLLPSAYSLGINLQFINTFDQANQTLLHSSGITNEKKQLAIWNDQFYGMKNQNTLSIWIISLMKGKSSYEYQQIKDWFQLTEIQIEQINKELQNFINIIQDILETSYCKDVQECNANYLAALQWSQTNITSKPPVGTPQPSVVFLNTSNYGFIEIEYFYKEYFIKEISDDQSYNISFNPQWTQQLLKHAEEGGTPITDSNILLHKGNLDILYENGNQYEKTKNLQYIKNIGERFDIDNINQTFVFWKYMKYIYEDFSIQKQLNGTNEILGLTYYLYQAFQPKVYELEQYLATEIYSRLMKIQMDQQNMTDCKSTFQKSVENMNEDKLNYVCSLPQFQEFGQQSIKFMINICLQTQTTEIQNIIQEHNLQLEVLEFCDTQDENGFGYLLQNQMKNVKSHYQCNDDYLVCRQKELAYMQLGNSAITQNVMPELQDQLVKTMTVSDWNKEIFPNAFEYRYFLDLQNQYPDYFGQQDQLDGFSLDESMRLFNFNLLFNAQVLQKILIYHENNNSAEFTKMTGLQNELLPTINNYVKFLFMELTLGGFVQTRSARELLFGYQSPLLTKLKNANTYQGGNPSYPNVVSYQVNQTFEESNFQMQLYTGKTKIEDVGQYFSINGCRILSYYQKGYDGNKTYDTEQISWETQESYQGSDSTHNPPNLDENSIVGTYIFDFHKSGKSSYNQQKIKYNDVETMRFIEDKSSNLRNPLYYQEYDRAINLTKIKQAPLIITNYNGYNFDPRIPTPLLYSTDGNRILPNTENDMSFEDLEPTSGVCINAKLKIQTNFELKQDSLFFSNNWQLVPLFAMNRQGAWSNEAIDQQFGLLDTANKLKNIMPQVFWALFGICILIFIFLIWRKFKQNKNQSSIDKQSIKYKINDQNSQDYILVE